MGITVAKTAGFCFGVKRAVDGVYNAIERGEKIATLGAIIHNRQVTDDLLSRGVNAYDSPEDVPEGYTIVIRAHGVGKDIYERIGERPYIDLTCPYVAKIHKIVEKYHNDGYRIVIVGDRDHPEVKGINGWCDHSALIIDSESTEIDVEIGNKPLCIVAQTTIKKNNFVQIVQILKETGKLVESVRQKYEKYPKTVGHIFDAMENIANDAKTNPEKLITAPHKTPVKRLDETLAARHPNLKFVE